MRLPNSIFGCLLPDGRSGHFFMGQDCDHEYNQFPARTIGGPAGDYIIRCPVQSNRWAEYQIVAIAAQVAAQVVVSGDSKPVALLYDGSKKLSDDSFFVGTAYTLSANQPSITPSVGWERITDSQGQVFVRLDAAGGNSVYVTVRFRTKILTVIPGPAETIHPDLGHQMNIKRSQNIKDRLAKAGIPERVELA